MLRKVIMPALGLDMRAGIIAKWLKREGDEVVRDEPLAVVDTDKATAEICAPEAGVLRQIVQPEGASVPIADTVAFLETNQPVGAPLSEMEGSGGGNGGVELNGGISAVQVTAAHPGAAKTGRSDQEVSVRASPAARHAARELGVDLAEVKGSGPRGRIQADDVRRFVDERQGSETPVPTSNEGAAETSVSSVRDGLRGRLTPLSKLRRLTAERMDRSVRSVARVTMNMAVDAGELIRVRGRLLPFYEARCGTKLSYNDLIVKVVAIALVEHPYINAQWTEEGVFLVESVNVGVAVAADEGLVVPIIRNADRKRLADISVELSTLMEKARANKLALEDVTGGTFTVTNLGMFGVESFTPIVNPPEAAILGLGRMVESPVGRDGQIVLRPIMTLSLSFDHRIVDGVPAAQFLQRLKQLLEEPCLLI